jgi:nickel/cobalt transporter (NicO) family protein
MAAGAPAAAHRRVRRVGRRGDPRVTLTLALVAAAVSIGSIHTLAPDHWVPFAALARAQRWPARRTALITAACGLGHVTGSVALGLFSVFLGVELLERFGRHVESVSGLLLIGFGVAYAVWGLRRGTYIHKHGHGHDHSDGPRHLTPWTLFLLFTADPCVAVIPLIFAAAPLGWGTTLAVIAAYEVATIGTMVALVLPTRAAATAARGAWVDRHGDALAGCVVALVGLAVLGLGI